MSEIDWKAVADMWRNEAEKLYAENCNVSQQARSNERARIWHEVRALPHEKGARGDGYAYRTLNFISLKEVILGEGSTA